ncbi:transcriptional regulator GlxA family with amidase domain [Pseudomonas hunanensis]|uniref:Transcriptional regulator GlxA family with amidase domain n=1 Tax=Pseudomonas hunanensis TaxID=1247546 RepID=A0ACC6K286_9PSED|nr:GlxA family transcriptional regulator [Pseudomonas hunanensis]MDR6712502.1 transcriptional regulator GlxA family with amidase domain [Pseudomonas hunanensis]
MKILVKDFSLKFADRNLRYTTSNNTTRKPSKIGFLLLENFSLPCFTQSLDVLVTANVIQPGSVRVHTFSQNNAEVMSDLAIPIRPDTPLTDVRLADLDLMIICGGLRTPRAVPPWLVTLLQKLASLPMTLGGLWNGAWYLGKAGLLDGYRCAIHPEQRTALAERSPHANVSLDTLVFDRDRLTAATPAGAFQMMLTWLTKCAGSNLADAVLDMLDYDQSRYRSSANSSRQRLTSPLREIITLMESNLEEPIEPEQLSQYVGLSQRQIQRLFRDQLATTPQKYYLQFRITEARRLIQNSSASIVDVGLACGFVSSSHFSKCYSALFGYPPSREARYEL